MANTMCALWWIVALTRVMGSNGNTLSCGILHLTMTFENDGNIEAQMRLEVSPELQDHFANPGYNKYRWLFKNRTNFLVIYRKGSPNYDGHKKYSESNLTLSLKYLSHGDEGFYRVQCWTVERPTETDRFYYSSWANLSLPVTSLPVTGIVDLNSSTCGRMELTKSTDPGGQIQASIRWHVNDQFISSIERKRYRWLHANASHSLVITLGNNKYSEVDLTLNIKHLTQGDEGDYYVECWNKAAPNPATEIYKSTKAYVSPPIIAHTTTRRTNPTESTSVILTGSQPSRVSGSSLDGGTDTVVIVVALSAVVIVVIISGTVILILRKRSKQEGRQILVKREESLERAACKDFDTESVYNEITDSIPNQMTDEYVEINLTSNCSSSRQLLVSHDVSPRLPKRPNVSGNVKSKSQYEDNYAMIEARDSKEEQVVAEISVEYAKVVPKSGRKDDEQECSSGVAEDKDDTAEMTYAKVIPKSERQLSNESDKIEQACINDKDRVTPDGLAKCNIEVAADDSHVYSNTKPRVPLKKTNELTYVELDHSVSRQTPPPEEPSARGHLAVADGSSEYVSIDFNKQAFVAPVRKAPSSWYKRRNKKKKP